MKKYILFTLLIVSLLSCTKTIDFNDEGFANQLVLNSIFWPDAAFKASLNKSTSILENSDGPGAIPTDATMDLYENNQLLAHLAISDGAFSAPEIKPKAGNTYKAVVSSQGKEITAETVIPMRTEVISVDTISAKTNYNYRTMNFNIKMKDAPGEDYYRILLEYEYLDMIKNRDINNKEIRTYHLFKNTWNIQSEDPVFKSVYNNTGEEIFDIGPENRYKIFPDDFFNGKEQSIQVKSSYYYNFMNPADPNMYGVPQAIYKRFTVHVQHLSKDLYNYLKYLELYEYYNDNPIAEPVPVYSNVKNGVGIFAGFNDDAKYTFENIYTPFSMDTIKIENPNGGGGGYGGGYGY